MFLRRWIERLLNAANPPRSAPAAPPAPTEPDPRHPQDDSFAERARVKGILPQHRDLWRQSTQLLQDGQYDQAIAAFLDFVARCPEMAADGYAGAARAVRQLHGHADDFPPEPFSHPLPQEQRDRAIAYYRQALAADPEHVKSLTGLAHLLDAASPERMALLEKAREVYARLPRRTHDYRTLLDLGDCYRLAEQPERAEEAYKEAVRVNANGHLAYERLIALCDETGRRADAKHWRRAMSERSNWRRQYSPPKPERQPPATPLPENVWCPIANIVEERPYGPGDEMHLSGTKRFAPKAKVYVLEVFRYGDRAEVVGRHRGSHRFIKSIVQTRVLTSCRAKLVYSPQVIRWLIDRWDGSETSRKNAEAIADRLNE